VKSCVLQKQFVRGSDIDVHLSAHALGSPLVETRMKTESCVSKIEQRSPEEMEIMRERKAKTSVISTAPRRPYVDSFKAG
jgi:hypothetical protein